MSRAYKCDACGEFYNPYKVDYIVKANYGFCEVFDLCPKCTDKVKDILSNSEEDIKHRKAVEKKGKKKDGNN